MSIPLSEHLSALTQQHLHDDVQQLALQRNRYPQLSDADFRFLLQQIEGRQKTKDKLPSFCQMDDWWYPVRLSCEQCSSEATARYKAQMVPSYHTFIDLTAGYGVDTFFLSEHAQVAHYVERNADLCTIAAHNFSLYRPKIEVHNTTAEDFLASLPIPNSSHSECCPIGDMPSTTLIYLDPARRSQSGSKVFRIEDCEPNITTLLPTLRNHASHIMIKFSPMLDVTAALRLLGQDWDTHIVAVNNEVKEVLFLTGQGTIHAVNILPTHTDRFVFTDAEEKSATPLFATQVKQYLYEPNAAIIKSGAFRLICQRFAGLEKLDKNTHLYTSSQLLPDFPGRVWQVLEPHLKDPKSLSLNKNTKFSILSRNYPLSPDQMRKKWKLQDGNAYYLIGARIAGKPTLMLCSRC